MTVDPPTMVIELCGLPGAGKTTLARRLAALDPSVSAALGRSVSAAEPLLRRLPRKLAAATSVIGRSPAQAWADVRGLGLVQSSPRDMLAVPLQWWVAQGVVRSARRATGEVVLEEGLLQASWSAALRTPRVEPPQLLDRLTRIPLPDLLVHVDVPVDVALARLQHRPSRHSRVQHLDQARQLSALSHGARLIEELVDGWRHRRLSPVVTINGSDADAAVTLSVALAGARHAARTPRGRPS